MVACLFFGDRESEKGMKKVGIFDRAPQHKRAFI